MGHDIDAYRLSDSKHSVTHLRRGALDSLKDAIYKALDCEKLNARDSGSGDKQTFTRQQLVRAKNRLKGEEYQYERTFLSNCLANLEEEKIIIYFG